MSEQTKKVESSKKKTARKKTTKKKATKKKTSKKKTTKKKEEKKKELTIQQKATALAEWVKKETEAFETHIQNVASQLGLEIEIQTFLNILNKEFSVKQYKEQEAQK